MCEQCRLDRPLPPRRVQPSSTAFLRCSPTNIFGESCPDACIQYFRERTHICPRKNRQVRAGDIVNMNAVLCELDPAVVGGVFTAVVGIFYPEERDPSRVA